MSATLLRAPQRFLARLEDWLIPPTCLHCGRERHRGFPLCRACLRILRDARPENDEVVTGMPWIRAQFRLCPPLHTLIHGFKYRHQRRDIRFLCAWLRWRLAWLEDIGETYDCVAPVPLHPARKRERGYNQAHLMALEITRLAGLPRPRAPLRRTLYTRTQTRLGGRARHGNLERAFRAIPGQAAGRRFLLVDDVCTTGSTLTHCREALLRAGAARVDALVLAHVEHRAARLPPDLQGLAGFFT